MTFEEALDVTRIYSVADRLPPDTRLIHTRPFRAPHHTISHAGLVGGGNWPRPGEISLSHRGVLFLDELPELANFMLVAAMNPCPCGYFGDAERTCSCSPAVVTRYQKRISGPLLDRIDIHVEVPRVDFEKLTDDRLGEPSAQVRARVEAAREVQRERFLGISMTCNADMGPAAVFLEPA